MKASVDVNPEKVAPVQTSPLVSFTISYKTGSSL